MLKISLKWKFPVLICSEDHTNNISYFLWQQIRTASFLSSIWQGWCKIISEVRKKINLWLHEIQRKRASLKQSLWSIILPNSEFLITSLPQAVLGFASAPLTARDAESQPCFFSTKSDWHGIETVLCCLVWGSSAEYKICPSNISAFSFNRVAGHSVFLLIKGKRANLWRQGKDYPPTQEHLDE